MAGPIIGAPLGGAIAGLIEDKESAAGSFLKDPSAIIVPTVLQTSIDVVNWFTSITCLYNKHWYAGPDTVTLPVTFFHVTGISEEWSVTTSRKRVLLYEPDGELAAADAAYPVREGVMQTIVDNRVVEPKQYMLEIIIPFQPMGRKLQEGIKTVWDVMFGLWEMLAGGDANSVEVLGYIESTFAPGLQLAQLLQQAAALAGKLPDTQGINYINKNSLEAMIESGLVLTMKMWTGFDYKYVMITDAKISKRPLEDDVFRGTLQVQEIPVLAITPPKDKTVSPINRTWAASAVRKASVGMQTFLVAPLVQLTGVAQASGDTRITKEAVVASIPG